MFVNAIEEVAQFTRPIHTITRNYGETLVSPGAATLFFVNENGCAITCRHVVDLIGNRQAINDKYKKFQLEKNKIGKNNKYNQRIKALEEEYNFKEDTINQLKYDVSILIFEDFKNPLYQSHAKFIKDASALKQGKFLCRLGFPFPEF